MAMLSAEIHPRPKGALRVSLCNSDGDDMHISKVGVYERTRKSEQQTGRRLGEALTVEEGEMNSCAGAMMACRSIALGAVQSACCR
jgi:hypothetical protein